MNAFAAYEINPLLDSRWPAFLQENPRASIFHTSGWLDALKRTYGYEPVAYTTSPPEAPLNNGWAFCRVYSWLTGHRAVSLPFSDHCDPLVPQQSDFDLLLRRMSEGQERLRWKYVEFRPPTVDFVPTAGFQPSQTFCLHRLDLEAGLEELFRHLHKDSTQRKIQRAEREGLAYSEGRSSELLEQFYGLLQLSRRRHYLPPQPFDWFSNLLACLGDSAKLRVASHQGRPVAGILTLCFKDSMFYKYGGSDAAFHNLGGMHLCLWRAIQDAKSMGLKVFDLGRSDSEDAGLIAFKDRWGAQRHGLTYFRRWLVPPNASRSSLRMPRARRAVAHVPGPLLRAAGRFLYRHLG
jgi:Acetyltransferase (GNAT) domain